MKVLFFGSHKCIHELTALMDVCLKRTYYNSLLLNTFISHKEDRIDRKAQF